MAKAREEISREEANELFAQSPEEIDENDAIILNQIMGAEEEIRNAPKVKMIMHNQEGPDGDKPVFVAVNGVGYSIPREMPVIVPKPIVGALETAVETKYYREEKDGQFFGPLLERTVRRFPFSLLG